MASPDAPKVAPLEFPTPAAFRRWLQRHCSSTEAVWLRLGKKGSGLKLVNYVEALDQALCFGWIDGQKKPLDAHSWLQKFSRRRARSLWSRRNIEHVARLVASRQMTAAGLVEVDAAKADGRWGQAYDSPANASVPDDLLRALKARKAASAFFESLTRTNRYAITWRLQTAKKPETRARRLALILEMLEQGQTFHPQKRKA
jgi:uncharacterized protein YdeI (YjbR/CyaY-like superfamily)